MDPVKEAFKKVKEDMDFLRDEMNSLKMQIKELKTSADRLISDPNKQRTIPTDSSSNPTYAKEIPTHNLPFNPLKPLILGISSGNGGVPTDKQTNQQTNQHIPNSSSERLFTPENSLEDALKILNSLDNIKKEIRLKFKELTEQEFLVFSMIYQLDEEQGYSDYRMLSKKLNLSESSVRDYVGKLIKKEIPVDKVKINNKNIKLSVSGNLKKIVSLNTILQLRGI
jgi:hypothetical protein